MWSIPIDAVSLVFAIKLQFVKHTIPVGNTLIMIIVTYAQP